MAVELCVLVLLCYHGLGQSLHLLFGMLEGGGGGGGVLGKKWSTPQWLQWIIIGLAFSTLTKDYFGEYLGLLPKCLRPHLIRMWSLIYRIREENLIYCGYHS